MTEYEELVAKFGYTEEFKLGVNADGDNVLVSIDENLASIRTFQKNGWIRINIYYRDGFSEELYER